MSNKKYMKIENYPSGQTLSFIEHLLDCDRHAHALIDTLTSSVITEVELPDFYNCLNETE